MNWAMGVSRFEAHDGVAFSVGAVSPRKRFGKSIEAIVLKSIRVGLGRLLGGVVYHIDIDIGQTGLSAGVSPGQNSQDLQDAVGVFQEAIENGMR
jgi:hypothetical protein